MNDDLFAQEQESPESQATKRELERQSQDSVRVYNPLDKDFITRWDGHTFVVPAKGRDVGYGAGQAIHPRYVALKYAREIVTYIFEHELYQAINEENQRRVSTGNRKMDKWMGAEEDIFGQQFITEKEQEKLKLYSQVILGIEHHYGMDEITQQETTPQRDPHMSDEFLFNTVLNRRATPAVVEPQPIVTPADQKEEFLDNISQ